MSSEQPVAPQPPKAVKAGDNGDAATENDAELNPTEDDNNSKASGARRFFPR